MLRSSLLTIACPNGENRNLPNSIRPKPMGAATTVAVRISPSTYTNIAFKNPKNGKCHNIFPSVFIPCTPLSKLIKLHYIVTTAFLIEIMRTLCRTCPFCPIYCEDANITSPYLPPITRGKIWNRKLHSAQCLEICERNVDFHRNPSRMKPD